MIPRYGKSLGSQELSKHRAMVAVELEVMAKKVDRFGWDRDRGTMAHDRIVSDWMDALQDYPLGEVKAACAEWVLSNPRKMPNEGDIVSILHKCRADAYAPCAAEMAAICRDVADKHSAPEWALRGRARDDRTCDARAEAIARCRQRGIPLTVIGEFFGGRDHTTVMAAIERHKRNTEAQQ
jgi:hypothetical protein